MHDPKLHVIICQKNILKGRRKEVHKQEENKLIIKICEYFVIQVQIIDLHSVSQCFDWLAQWYGFFLSMNNKKKY